MKRELQSTRPSAEIVAFPQSGESATFALAASAELEANAFEKQTSRTRQLRRLPLNLEQASPLCSRPAPLLPYASAESLRSEAAFARPEGSFVARAFGNAVHRYLHLFSVRLAAGQSLPDLQAELQTWAPRVQAILRGEGLSPTQAGTETVRALGALRSTLADPYGSWLLAPRSRAQSEAALPGNVTAESASLRADRTFFAGPHARSDENPDYLWIVDYKTTELGARTQEVFLAKERQKYAPQMQAYAQAAVLAGNEPDRIILALYFPMLATLLWWRCDDGIPRSNVTVE